MQMMNETIPTKNDNRTYLIGDNGGYADRSEAEELLFSEFTLDEE